jgi:hypothetical protein
MAAYFHGSITCNNSSGNWLALPALPTGMERMRRVYFRGDQVIEIGYGTAGQSAANLEVMCVGGTGGSLNGGRALGLLDYPRLVARSAVALTGTLYVYSFAIGDEPMKGF